MVTERGPEKSIENDTAVPKPVIYGEGQIPILPKLPRELHSEQAADISAITPELVQALVREVKQLRAENKNLTCRDSELTIQNGELLEENRALSVQSVGLQDQCEALQKNNQELAEQQLGQEARISDLETRLRESITTTETRVHDLRGPITAIRGQAQMLEKREPDPSKRRFIEAIVNATRRANSMITEVMDTFSVIKEPTPQVIDINNFLQDVINDKISLAQNGNAEIVGNFSEQSISIYIDPKQFLLAFDNLLVNAIHATEECSEGRVIISTEIKDKTVIISIEDNGTGMSENTQARCFEELYTTKKGTKQEGSGKGLSITRKIIEGDCGGKVELVQSKPGVGTKFTVSLPIHNAA